MDRHDVMRSRKWNTNATNLSRKSGEKGEVAACSTVEYSVVDLQLNWISDVWEGRGEKTFSRGTKKYRETSRTFERVRSTCGPFSLPFLFHLYFVAVIHPASGIAAWKLARILQTCCDHTLATRSRRALPNARQKMIEPMHVLRFSFRKHSRGRL